MSFVRNTIRTGVIAGMALGLVAVTSPAHARTREIDPTDSATAAGFGASVAMDGDTLVVGAPGTSTARGAVYVYTRGAGETWTQTSKLTASDAADSDQLGFSVAIDGDTIVAGAPGAGTGGASSPGAVYLFARTGAATRTQDEKLTASDQSPGDGLGSAVDIDGDVIVAGAPDDDLPGENIAAGHGSVYTFATTGAAGRTQSAKLTASDNIISGFAFAGSRLGESVAIDGDTIVAGAPRDYFGNTSGPVRGSVYTFARTGSADRQQTAKLTVTGQVTGRLGESVDIEGDTIVAGDSEADEAFGAAWLFSRTGNATRNQVGKLTPSNPQQNKQYGTSVSISSSFIVVGATSFSTRGQAFVFTRSGAPNRTQTWFTSGTSPFAELYGASVVTDGDRVVGGAPGTKISTSDGRGRVYSSTPELSVSKLGTGSGTVTADQPGMSCEAGPPCFAGYLLGDQVTLTATANPGSFFAGWSNYPGCAASTSPTCVVTMNGEPQAAATFTQGTPPDVTPPTVSIDSGPANGSTVTNASVTFGFSTNETATFQCAYDGAAFGSCTAAPQGISGSDTRTLSEAAHVFKVRATDLAGNPSTEQTRSFTVDFGTPPDVTPPTVLINSGPANGATVTTSSATFGFSADETATFQCSYDGAGFTPCTAPGPGASGSDTRSGLSEGPHSFKVRATDLALNTSAEQTRSFIVDLPSPPPPPPPADTTAPATTVTKAPPKTVTTSKATATITIKFSASENATFVCQVDGHAAKSCASPLKLKLKPGKHIILITATDEAGNREASAERVQVKVKKKQQPQH